MDALEIERAVRRRLRLGRPGRLRRRGALAGARDGAGLGQFLQHPEHRPLVGAGRSGAGGRLLVPVVFRHRARPARAGRQPARHRRAAVAHVVAGMGLRRRDLRAHRPPPSTTPISSRSSSTRTGTATGWCRATRPSRISRRALTALPPITVPAVTVDGAADGVSGTTQHHARRFTGPHRHRIWPGAGPQPAAGTPARLGRRRDRGGGHGRGRARLTERQPPHVAAAPDAIDVR